MYLIHIHWYALAIVKYVLVRHFRFSEDKNNGMSCKKRTKMNHFLGVIFDFVTAVDVLNDV